MRPIFLFFCLKIDCKESWVGGGRGHIGTWTVPQGIAWVLTFFLVACARSKQTPPFLTLNAETKALYVN
jgi:hypothetical protein